MNAERIRQKGFQEQQAALAKGSQDRYQNFEQQQGQSAQQLGDFFQQQPEAVQAAAPSALPASSSNITVQEQGKQQGKAKAYNDQQGAALGNLRAFGDVLGDIGRGVGRDSQQIGQLGDFSRGSNAVLPFELEDANQAGAGLGMLGDILGGAGQLGITAGLSGAGANLFGGGGPTVLGKAGGAASKVGQTVGGTSTFGLNPYGIY